MTGPTGTCARCGVEQSDLPRLDWVFQRTAEGVTWLCSDCARRHARDIESGLSPEWW